MLDGQRLFNRLGEELLVLAGGEDACGTKDVTGRALDASRRARLAADLDVVVRTVPCAVAVHRPLRRVGAYRPCGVVVCGHIA